MGDAIIWIIGIAIVAWLLLIPQSTKDNLLEKIGQETKTNVTNTDILQDDRNITLGYAPCITDEQCIAVYNSVCKSDDYNIKNCFCEQITGLCKLK